MKDKRDKVFVKGHIPGVANVFIESGTKADTEAFKVYDMNEFQARPEMLAELGLNAIVYRKGEDGETPMKQSATSEYNWRQFITIIGEENNTVEGRRELANAFIAHLNSTATADNYQFPKRVRFGGDLTASPLTAADDSILDADVLGLILAAYPDNTVEEMFEWDEIIGQFWSNVDHGKAVLEAHVNDVAVSEQV